MDNYVIRSSPPPEDLKPSRRDPWKRVVSELDGKFSLKYRREAAALMLRSYNEVGKFPHLYNIYGVKCPTHTSRLLNAAVANQQLSLRREGISGLEFDSKGIYLASVTKSGCLLVQDFEALYCLSNDSSTCQKKDEDKHLIHISTGRQLDVVRWNLANQDEVACTSALSNEVLIFDIGYISSDPIEVLKKRSKVTVNGCEVPRGLSDVATSSMDKSRLLAADRHGLISVWDRRMSNLACAELTTNTNGRINSVQLCMDNQIVYGAGKHGIIYAWDLRGGRTSAAFQNNKEICHPPIISLKLAPQLEKIPSLKAQSVIVPREIYSIDIDPSAPYQLAFHLDNGWSGVVNTDNWQVTHIHCPPPAWLSGMDSLDNYPFMRKPAWLPNCSIYAVGSTFDNGIHLLDFYPAPISACHVDFNEEMLNAPTKLVENRFVSLSDYVTACASHPLNGTIIAGTKQSSLLVISQKSVHSGNQSPE